LNDKNIILNVKFTTHIDKIIIFLDKFISKIIYKISLGLIKYHLIIDKIKSFYVFAKWLKHRGFRGLRFFPKNLSRLVCLYQQYFAGMNAL